MDKVQLRAVQKSGGTGEQQPERLIWVSSEMATRLGQVGVTGVQEKGQHQVVEHGQRVRYAGLVICRQRPGTAGGVVFMTLEDETGFVNVVLWQRVFERYSLLAKTAIFLGVTGKLQIEQNVVHLVAETLWTPRVHLAPATLSSRDFH